MIGEKNLGMESAQVRDTEVSSDADKISKLSIMPHLIAADGPVSTLHAV